MKRLLLTLLVIAMLVPGLACGGMPCARAAEAKVAMAAMKMPCAHCPHENGSSKQVRDIMLMSDCSHTPLMGAGAQSVLPPLDLMHHDIIMTAHMPAVEKFLLANTYTIRGPPDVRPLSANTPVFLSTLRIRI